MRQITKQEWEEQEFIEVTTIADQASGRRVFLPGLKKTEPPDPPDDEHVYFAKETTSYNDKEQSWYWIPAMTDGTKVAD